MKAKLLKKLRKRFVIQQRNKEYRVIDYLEKSGGVFTTTDWIMSLQEVKRTRRSWILGEAQKYKRPKRELK